MKIIHSSTPCNISPPDPNLVELHGLYRQMEAIIKRVWYEGGVMIFEGDLWVAEHSQDLWTLSVVYNVVAGRCISYLDQVPTLFGKAEEIGYELVGVPQDSTGDCSLC